MLHLIEELALHYELFLVPMVVVAFYQAILAEAFCQLIAVPKFFVTILVAVFCHQAIPVATFYQSILMTLFCLTTMVAVSYLPDLYSKKTSPLFTTFKVFAM